MVKTENQSLEAILSSSFFQELGNLLNNESKPTLREIKQQIDDLLAKNIIRHSCPPWSSPVWLVPKKKDAAGTQKWRLIVDFRKLNEKTIKDRYPMPVISEVLDKLGRANDIPKTAFTTDSGHFE